VKQNKRKGSKPVKLTETAPQEKDWQSFKIPKLNASVPSDTDSVGSTPQNLRVLTPNSTPGNLFSENESSDSDEQSTSTLNAFQISSETMPSTSSDVRVSHVGYKTPVQKTKHTPNHKPKSRKYRRKQHALREIKAQQKSVENCIKLAPFRRLVREITQNLNKNEYLCGDPSQIRFQSEAILCLREGAEIYLTHMFDMANRAAIHARRVTIMPRDIDLIRLISSYRWALNHER
jgi:histone H3/H4